MTPGQPMFWLPLLVLAAAVIFWAYCLADFTRADPRRIRGMTRDAWLVLLVVGNVFGGLAWLLAGRPRPR